MLYIAAHEFGIDLSASLMIGDSMRDLQAGIAAGCVSLKIQDIIAMPEIKMQSLLDRYNEINRMRIAANTDLLKESL